MRKIYDFLMKETISYFETMKATGYVSEKVSFYDKIGALLMDHHFHVSFWSHVCEQVGHSNVGPPI